jgi:hypothetical protein
MFVETMFHPGFTIYDLRLTQQWNPLPDHRARRLNATSGIAGAKAAHAGKSARGEAMAAGRERVKNAQDRLLLPGALLVTIQAQLLAPFVLVDFCLAAFFD